MPQKGGPRPRSILVVDDSQIVLALVGAVLRRLGFDRVDEARNGAAALARLEADDYDLVISDWNMAPMTGYELLRRVRADERLRGTPFIMMTVDTDPDKVVAAKRAGVSGCLIKPFTLAALREKIGSFCDMTEDAVRPAEDTESDGPGMIRVTP